MCKKYFLSFFVLIIAGLGNSCTQRDSNAADCRVIDVKLKDNHPIYLSSLFDSIQTVFFETNDSSLIGENPVVNFTSKTIFIESNNTINIFNHKGEYLNIISKRGSGRGEYTGISDFIINEKFNRIEILDKRQKKILYYGYDGEYIDDYPIDIWAIKIFRDSHNRLYTYSGYERDDDNIFQFNVFDGEEKCAFSEINKKKSEFLHIACRKNFTQSEKERILFFEPFNDTIYTLKRDKINPEYVISYDGKNVPEAFYRNSQFANVFEFFQALKKQDYINSTYNVIETDSKLSFYCLQGSKKYLIVYDKINNTAHSYDRIIDDLLTDGVELPFQDEEFIFHTRNNSALFLIHPSWFINNKSRLVSKEIVAAVNSIKEDDNPVGIFCFF